MKHILFLSIYYEPDLGAGSFRSVALVEELAKKLGNNGKVHVITTMPNRYQSFKKEALAHEERDNIVIDRVPMGAHKGGFVDQAVAYIHYYKGVKKITGNHSYNVVFATSQRLFTSYIGLQIAKKNRCPLYLDIRDLFVENITEIISNKLVSGILKPTLGIIEKMVFSKANHINLVSEGFMVNFKKYKKPNFTFFTNGIDDIFIGLEKRDALVNNPILITYAGNIGEGQGLEKIIPGIAAGLGSRFRIRVIGDGGTRKLLEDRIREEKIDNVEIIDPVKRDDLLSYYADSDYLFLHLNDYKAFEKVLPSKLFEYGASNIPILGGISGYSAEFASEYISNIFLFKPCDVNSVVKFLQSNQYSLQKRDDFVSRFRRERISKEMADSILSYL